MRRPLLYLALLTTATYAHGQTVKAVGRSLQLATSNGKVVVSAVEQDVLRIEFHPTGVASIPTDVMDPRGLRRARAIGIASGSQLKTSQLLCSISGTQLVISDLNQKQVASIDLAALAERSVKLTHPDGQNLYGMRGNGLFTPADSRTDLSAGILRNGGAHVAAGQQGDGGAPFAFSTKWGLFVDSVDGDFLTPSSTELTFKDGSRKDIEAYFVVGAPKRSIAALTNLTGKPQMPPKWSLGFMNSQWGTDEKSVTSLVAQYREKRIPLDCFILDFDFKAWGEDNYGEWRWNSTNGPGNVGPMKYPNGQSGLFGKRMAEQGVQIVGIMKPRILIENSDKKPTKAALEATQKGWWMPGKKPYEDYFSHRLANDFDFSKPDLRKWYWERSKNLFETGISGWWNDEADGGFDSLGHFHMQQSLFEGQRSISKRRVWSISRNFYSGAQRFSYGIWSGDINTGFDNMADQRARMLMLLNLGQPHWSMDTGGFIGHPSNENYARWMQFAATVPIMRVHGLIGEFRQPWVYGPVAEKAATQAIRWRYSMLPSLYSWEHEASQTGVGIARPLFWEFPEDPKCANITDSWMMGEGLLVAPIVDAGQTKKTVYLPEGSWWDMSGRQWYQGGQTIELNTDSKTWSDTPMFVRAGTILATQPVLQYTTEHPVEEITLDVWPSATKPARFEVYDDDGLTTANERGAFFSQRVEAVLNKDGIEIKLGIPKKGYTTSIKSYRLRIHQAVAGGLVTWNGVSIPSRGQDDYREVEIPAGEAGKLTLVNAH